MEQMQGRNKNRDDPSWKAFTGEIHIFHDKICFHLHTVNINKLQKEAEFHAKDKEILLPEWDIVTVLDGWCFNSSTEDSAEHNCKEVQSGAANTCASLEI